METRKNVKNPIIISKIRDYTRTRQHVSVDIEEIYML